MPVAGASVFKDRAQKFTKMAKRSFDDVQTKKWCDCHKCMGYNTLCMVCEKCMHDKEPHSFAPSGFYVQHYPQVLMRETKVQQEGIPTCLCDKCKGIVMECNKCHICINLPAPIPADHVHRPDVHKFTCRVECAKDALKAVNALGSKYFLYECNISQDYVYEFQVPGDNTFSFGVNKTVTFEELVRFLYSIQEDWVHTMADTLNPSEKYDGCTNCFPLDDSSDEEPQEKKD